MVGTCDVADRANMSDVSPFGVRGMSGNVREWAADTHLAPADMRCWGNTPRTNPVCTVMGAGILGGTDYTWTGGSFSILSAEGVAVGFATSDDRGVPTVGFRCVRTVR